MQNRERWVTDTLVELADTLVPSLDPASYWLCVADRYTQLVASSSVHLSAAGDRATHPVVVNTDERLGRSPLDRILAEEGPGVDSRDGGESVNVLFDEATTRWPRLSPAALSLGYRSVHAFPLSRREDFLGTVTILTTETAMLPTTDLRVAHALADVATIGMLNHRAITGLTTTSEQLQGALTSRVIIEQAKGLVSARLEISPEAAFLLLRRYARSHNMKIGELCASLMRRHLTVDELTAPLPRPVKAGRRR
ncbi:GAF and ANTAR domain-containing protein [Amycolatopsis oliviviridis]|uniref:Transcriptional regulator n=1 Tax=Amycolatopsis oliviviridis TaxID=1471590 RepID=A0ABQ3LQP2_9PSEU|nr:ANTAR domain-containing protein [Amycolatopsis oliviviridis]GHH23561.1 transcriptional regulator [Amycolatopsis oliviviridis]